MDKEISNQLYNGFKIKLNINGSNQSKSKIFGKNGLDYDYIMLIIFICIY